MIQFCLPYYLDYGLEALSSERKTSLLVAVNRPYSQPTTRPPSLLAADHIPSRRDQRKNVPPRYTQASLLTRISPRSSRAASLFAAGENRRGQTTLLVAARGGHPSSQPTNVASRSSQPTHPLRCRQAAFLGGEKIPPRCGSSSPHAVDKAFLFAADDRPSSHQAIISLRNRWGSLLAAGEGRLLPCSIPS